MVFFPDYLILKAVKWEKISPLKGHIDGDLQVCQSDFGAGEDYGKRQLVWHRWHMQDDQGSKPSQHGVRKGRPWLMKWISFHEQVICLVDEGKQLSK